MYYDSGIYCVFCFIQHHQSICHNQVPGHKRSECKRGGNARLAGGKKSEVFARRKHRVTGDWCLSDLGDECRHSTRSRVANNMASGAKSRVCDTTM